MLRQALAGTALVQAVLPLRRRALARRRPGSAAAAARSRRVRNGDWRHLDNHDVMLMPDPWEYPWYAAWDLAFHCVTLAHIDPEFAKRQLVLLLREWYMHPNGQLPAYEWDFGDVNPPVQAWAALRVFQIDGATDFEFLDPDVPQAADQLHLVDQPQGRTAATTSSRAASSGLDNIGPLDRSEFLPAPGILEQSDGTAWMAMYCPGHVRYVAASSPSTTRPTRTSRPSSSSTSRHRPRRRTAGLWDEQDGFFYDVLRLTRWRDDPDQRAGPWSGLIPLAAARGITPRHRRPAARVRRTSSLVPREPPELAASVVQRQRAAGVNAGWLCSRSSTGAPGPASSSRCSTRPSCSPPTASVRSRRITGRTRVRDRHRRGRLRRLDYEPGESTTALFGGNSNWRGPIWFPLNSLLIESLRDYSVFGDTVHGRVPHRLGQRTRPSTSRRRPRAPAAAIFTPGADGRRPVFGGYEILQPTRRWRDLILVPRVLPRRHRRGPRRDAPDRLDRADRPPDPRRPIAHQLSERQPRRSASVACSDPGHEVFTGCRPSLPAMSTPGYGHNARLRVARPGWPDPWGGDRVMLALDEHRI